MYKILSKYLIAGLIIFLSLVIVTSATFSENSQKNSVKTLPSGTQSIYQGNLYGPDIDSIFAENNIASAQNSVQISNVNSININNIEELKESLKNEILVKPDALKRLSGDALISGIGILGKQSKQQGKQEANGLGIAEKNSKEIVYPNFKNLDEAKSFVSSKLGIKGDLVLLGKDRSDESNLDFIYYQQTYNDIPIYNGYFNVFEKFGKPVKISYNLYDVKDISTILL